MTTFSRMAALLGGLLLAACQYLVFVYAPIEAHMGAVQKIFYIHLPLAWWGLVSFFVVAVAGGLYLRTRQQYYDHLAHAAAEVGLLLCTLALVTGSIWARHSWGVWWTWDPRLTTALILWFLYAGYIMLRHLDLSPAKQASLCAVLGIVAFLDVPLVFLSARLWRSIHPAVFASSEGGLDPQMRVAAISMVVAFGFLWWALVSLRREIMSVRGVVEQLRVN